MSFAAADISQEELLVEEQRWVAQGARWIAGMDEVGRGALAGPVAVAAALLAAPLQLPPAGLDDSKKLTARRRESLVSEIEQWAHVRVGYASAAEIDRYGLSHCLGLAGQRALSQLPHTPDVLFLDGRHQFLPTPEFPVELMVKGDSRSAAIAAASVVAKVTRDQLMAELTYQNPELAVYGWQRNSGYGTAAHREAIRMHGPTQWHRKSWNLTQ